MLNLALVAKYAGKCNACWQVPFLLRTFVWVSKGSHIHERIVLSSDVETSCSLFGEMMIAPTFFYNHFGSDSCRQLHPRAQVYSSRVDTPEGKVLSLLLICLNLCRSARAALSLFVWACFTASCDVLCTTFCRAYSKHHTKQLAKRVCRAPSKALCVSRTPQSVLCCDQWPVNSLC